MEANPRLARSATALLALAATAVGTLLSGSPALAATPVMSCTVTASKAVIHPGESVTFTVTPLGDNGLPYREVNDDHLRAAWSPASMNYWNNKANPWTVTYEQVVSWGATVNWGVRMYAEGVDPLTVADDAIPMCGGNVRLASTLGTSITAAAPSFDDGAGTFTIPDDSRVIYEVNGVIRTAGTYPGAGELMVIAMGADGYNVTGASTYTHTFTTLASPSLTPVTPAAPTFTDEDGAANDTYTIPDTPGVSYQVDGVTVGAGVHQGAGDVTITAVADAGYVIDGDSTFSYSFSTLAPPAPPVADNLVSSGAGTAQQSARLTLPAGGSVTLLDATGEPATTVTTSAGTYVLDPATGVVTFVPATGYLGTPAPLQYEITDAYGQRSTGTFQVTITKPDAPVAQSKTSTGANGTIQQVSVDVPAGGEVALLDSHGTATSRVTIAGVGTFTVTETGLQFRPAKGAKPGTAQIQYRVVDAYGQASTSTYRVRITKAAPGGVTQPGRVHLKAPKLARSAKTAPVTVSVSHGKIAATRVQAYATVRGERQLVGTGTVRAGHLSRPSVTVPVRWNNLGRAMLAQPGGVKITYVATTRQAGVNVTRTATAHSRAVAPTVSLRPVYFTSASATLRPLDRTYLRQVAAKLGGAKHITVTGYTDAQSTTAYNHRLGLDRAKAVRSLLAGHGAQITVASRGETRPAADNTTSHGRALNRRAEVTIRY